MVGFYFLNLKLKVMMKQSILATLVLLCLTSCSTITFSGENQLNAFYEQLAQQEKPPHLVNQKTNKEPVDDQLSESWLAALGFSDQQSALSEKKPEGVESANAISEHEKITSTDDSFLSMLGFGDDDSAATQKPAELKASDHASNSNSVASSKQASSQKAQPKPVDLVALASEPEVVPPVQPELVLGPSLSAVVQRAVITHPSVKATEAKKLSSEYEVDSQVAGYFPSVDLESGIGFEDSDIVNRDSDTLLRSEAKISLRQLVFDGWETSSRVSVAKANLKAATAVLGAQQQETSLQAAASYIDVFRSKRFVSLAKKNLKNHKVLGKRIKKRAQTGYGNKANLAQVNARIALANARLIRFQGELDTATAQYQESVNELPPEGMTLPIIPDELVQEDVDSLIATAIMNNPALLASVHRIDEKVALTEQVESEFMPKIHVNLSSSWNDNVDGTRGKNNDTMGMVNLKYNLFNGAGSLARWDRANYELDHATQLMNAYKRQVIKEVRSAYIQLHVAHSRLPALKSHVKMASKVLKASYKQFKLGQRSILDLLDQRNELFQAEIALLTEQTRKIYATYRLLASQGDLLGYLQQNHSPTT